MLVVPRRQSDNVKRIIAQLDGAPRKETTDRQCVQRPWGYFVSLETGERFQVKCIVVNPGERLSLQKHFHRAEHWVVVCGTAEVTVDDRTMKLYENESVYIPMGAIHRLANPGKIPLKVIEVQSGSYLGEDDIVRFEDDYHRESTPRADDASYCDPSRPR
jgi:mannose-6-phosphate isomerase-like protein (cupin superfamily)